MACGAMRCVQWGARALASGPALASHPQALSSAVGGSSALRSLVGRGGSLTPPGSVAARSGMAFPGAHAGLRSLALSAACRAVPTGSAAAAGRRSYAVRVVHPAQDVVITPADAPDKSKFAVVKVGGKQYKVTEHDSIVVERRLTGTRGSRGQRGQLSPGDPPLPHDPPAPLLGRAAAARGGELSCRGNGK